MGDSKRQLEIITPLKELTSDATHLVKIDQSILNEITAGDPNPEYVVLEVDEGKSDNNVTYDRDFFERLARQVNEKQPAGYLGHKHFQGLDKEDLLPDPQAVWLGATVTTGANGKSRLIAKGYLLPKEDGGKARAWIKRKAINSASWAIDASVAMAKDGSYRVKDFVLESIDFARKNREGMKNQTLRLVTEMEGDDKKVTPEEIRNLQLAELQVNNPELVLAIKEQTKNELTAETNQKIEDAKTELTAKHDDELKKVPEITLMQKVRDLLGIKEDDDADPIAALTALIERLDDLSKKYVQAWFKDEILDKKISNDRARKLVSRLIPVTEMKGDWHSEKGIEKIKEQLENKADDLLENDDDIKVVLKEMAGSRGGARVSDRPANRQRKPDGENEYSDLERSGNVKVETVKLGV